MFLKKRKIGNLEMLLITKEAKVNYRWTQFARKYSTKLLTPKRFRLVMVIGLSGVQFALMS